LYQGEEKVKLTRADKKDEIAVLHSLKDKTEFANGTHLIKLNSINPSL